MRSWAEITLWRKAERERLVAARLAMPVDERSRLTVEIARRLDDMLANVAGQTVSFYWPFRGEPDLRSWATALQARGATTALPVVVAKGQPLAFRAYAAGDRLEKGVWNIPVPSAGAEVIPTVVIAPVVGIDRASFRLGYGGGFFDRTLAALPRKPLTIGVGYQMQRIETIHPQPHDVPMDAAVTA